MGAVLEVKVLDAQAAEEPAPAQARDATAAPPEPQGEPAPRAGPSIADRILYARSAGVNAKQRIDGLQQFSFEGEKSSLAPRYYVVLRDRLGIVYNPCLVYRRWGDFGNIVEDPGSRRGRRILNDLSVFEGWPSEGEAQAYAAGAGAGWPPA